MIGTNIRSWAGCGGSVIAIMFAITVFLGAVPADWFCFVAFDPASSTCFALESSRLAFACRWASSMYDGNLGRPSGSDTEPFSDGAD